MEHRVADIDVGVCHNSGVEKEKKWQIQQAIMGGFYQRPQIW
jgi:hypothetical protein